jgi:hypothetical protein
MTRTPLLTLDVAIRAVSALRELHRVCEAMDAERESVRPSEEDYQAAMAEAARVLHRTQEPKS